MLFFRGEQPYTDFRHNKLTQALSQSFPELTDLTAYYGYFVDVAAELSSADIERLEVLFKAKQVKEPVPFCDDLHFWCVPRVGTISPWSSKATDIVASCGFEQIKRVERGIYYQLGGVSKHVATQADFHKKCRVIIDPLTQSLLFNAVDLERLFGEHQPQPGAHIPLLEQGKSALENANQQLGLALSDVEMDYLQRQYKQLKRDPTDTELMMFAQVNSEHCRHKIFNARWKINGKSCEKTLFQMIKNTYQKNPQQVLVAYKDNAAVLTGNQAAFWQVDFTSKVYQQYPQPVSIVLKVETHNHPTAISPFSGAATGSGGEIRDEGATGRGAKPIAGMCGFAVSNLEIPDLLQPWELNIGKPAHMASALDIMLEGPIGAASFNNEFGRPNICGYFRTLTCHVKGDAEYFYRGYHKPIMIAGGVGVICKPQIEKQPLPAGAKLIVLGGPAMAIGLGGGAASSKSSSDGSEDLDFASVQRANPEMERRAQEVINSCWSLGEANPILSIHDVGAGGLSNAVPEIVESCQRGAWIHLRDVPNDEQSMTPLEIWCNEAQERYVLAILPNDLPTFIAIAERERCLFAVIGEATTTEQLFVDDTHFNDKPIDLPMAVLFDEMPQKHIDVTIEETEKSSFVTDNIALEAAIHRVLQHPTVASKQFLITIGDRSVTGLIARDQMVGPWQVPVADVAITLNDYVGYSGAAMAIGERPPLALINPAASARMAVAEALTNIMAADVAEIAAVSLSANWMAAANYPDEAKALYEAVKAIGMALCPALDIAIPVGKDSLSMSASWESEHIKKDVVSPLSLNITAVAAVDDVRHSVTPQLQQDDDTLLVLVDFAAQKMRLGASILAQTYGEVGNESPDVDDVGLFKRIMTSLIEARRAGFILAYHDRSDGGLLACVAEMMFAGHVGVELQLSAGVDPLEYLFNEEIGVVLQIQKCHWQNLQNIFTAAGVQQYLHVIGKPNADQHMRIQQNDVTLYQESRVTLQRLWAKTSYHMQCLRDNSACAKQEYDLLLDTNAIGLFAQLTYDVNESITAPYLNMTKPKVAILREQGVNGQQEMAAAFANAGFESVDVHMSDLMAKRTNLNDFVGIAACGGFSFGDVLGAGRGWAQSILMNASLRAQFAEFFARDNTFTLGVCNGCQMLSHLREIIPGSGHWPVFVRNRSEQFEARVCMLEVQDTASIFLQGMAGSCLPVSVAHGEGRVEFLEAHDLSVVQPQVALRYIDGHTKPTEIYPLNPNGSVQGITGLTSEDGRVLIMMPHPERVYRAVQNSWCPADWQEAGAWARLFKNARVWVD